MENKTITRLEFDKVLQDLVKYTNSALGRERVEQLKPSTSQPTVLAWQIETSQAKELLRLEPMTDFTGWFDIRDQIKRLKREATLVAEELLQVGTTLASSRRIKLYLEERQASYPVLADIAMGLASIPAIEKEILRAIMPGGEIADNATPELYQIRRKLKSAQSKVRERLDAIIRSSAKQKYLQEAIVTIRGDRYVVPVKQEYRGQVPGIIHDQSASGATLFIEPMPVVEANNEVRRLMAAQREEITRILTRLSALAAGITDELTYSLDALGHLDFVWAKARYSDELDAWQPEIKGQANLNLIQARHPLLTGSVVPISIELGTKFNTLIITGPNTGGKTVTLKTVGLMVMMAQAGLHIPVETGSQLGIFKRVFADIGDEQSIEQSLSTFSSHMSNIVNIMRWADDSSLVLLDELGSGTDPTEGAALAQSILEKLHTNNIRTIATTHYSELKNFAYARPGVENASVEFNIETLQPTYRLLIGKPGRSNAFEIASRLGLDRQLVTRARDFLTEEQLAAAELMTKLEQTQQETEQERRQATQLRQEGQQFKERYAQLEQEVSDKREQIIDRARDQAEKILLKARQESEKIIKELRANLAQETAREREEAIKKARTELSTLYNASTRRKTKRSTATFTPPQKLQPGDEVYLPQYNQTGQVLSIGNKDVTVQAGILKFTVDKNQLQKVEPLKAAPGKSHYSKVALEKARNIKTDFDMRGMTVDEGLQELDKYLDDAYIAGLKKINLIHGKGTGVLRAAVQQALKGHPRIKKFRLGEMGEGGMGVTVAELK